MGNLYIDYAIRNHALSLMREYGVDPHEAIYCYSRAGQDLKLPSNDYALIRGPEVLLTCVYRGSIGQAFTVSPREYRGRIVDLLNLDLGVINNRALFYAFLNAFYRSLGLIKNTIHCGSHKPVKCGVELARYILSNYGVGKRVLHVGYQPAHIEYLAYYLRDNLLVTDLRSNTVWKYRYGRLVYDGLFDDPYIGTSDIILVTASSVINKSFWGIISKAHTLGKEIILYGISAPVLAYFISKFTPIKINIFCPYSK